MYILVEVCIGVQVNKNISLTRKLVGYRNWRQRSCKKVGNKVLGKKNETKIYSSFGSVTFTGNKYRIFVSFFFSQNLVGFLFTPLLPPIPISHQLSH